MLISTERGPGWFVHFLAQFVVFVKKQARKGLFDAYTYCWKNADLMFSLLISWGPREKVESKKSGTPCLFDRGGEGG